jgi:hypothetical protein
MPGSKEELWIVLVNNPIVQKQDTSKQEHLLLLSMPSVSISFQVTSNDRLLFIKPVLQKSTFR